jgi:hypothetical protein
VGYLLLANIVAATHLTLVAFLVGGGLLSWRWPRLAALHVPLAAAVLTLNLAGADCPLSTLELSLRRIAGEHLYTGGFVAHYLVEPIHPAGITTDVRLGIYSIAILPNVLAYTLLGWRMIARRSRRALIA